MLISPEFEEKALQQRNLTQGKAIDVAKRRIILHPQSTFRERERERNLPM